MILIIANVKEKKEISIYNNLTMSQGPKNERQILLGIASLMLCFILLDYYTIYRSGQIGIKSKLIALDQLFLIFHRFGEIIRALYVVSFAMLCYMAYTNMLLLKNNYNSKYSRSTLLIVSLISSLIFIECFRLEHHLAVIIYPISLIVCSVFIMLLMGSLSEIVVDEDNGTILGVEKEKIEKDYSFVLEAEGGYINIVNPFRSGLVIGSAGSGKSFSVVEPLILQSIKKGFSGILYDVKYSTLGDVAYSAFLYYQQKNVKFYPVSFTDVARSHRFNPLEPSLLKNAIYAEEYAYSLYSNLDKSMQKSSGGSEFFSQSAISILKGIIWFLKKNNPSCCTLPHIIDIISRGDDKAILKMILSDSETAGFIKSVKQAFDNEAMDQLSGQLGSLSNFIGKLVSKEVFWVFSGNDFTLDLNNPRYPGYVVLGNALDVREAMNPIIALTFTISLKLMNAEKRNPSVIIIDEGPTINIPKLDTIPATARSNKISLWWIGQDFSQADVMMGKDQRRALVSNLTYQFFGKVIDLETADYVSKLVGEEYRTITSFNKGGSSSESGDSTSNGASYSQQKRKIIEANQVTTLETGRFVGATAEGTPDFNFFNAKLKGIANSNPDFNLTPIPNFVENFLLDNQDEIAVLELAKEIFSKEDYYRSKDREINQTLNKFSGNAAKQHSELIILLQARAREDKKERILVDNFLKIQRECDNLLLMYANTDEVSSLINN